MKLAEHFKDFSYGDDACLYYNYGSYGKFRLWLFRRTTWLRFLWEMLAQSSREFVCSRVGHKIEDCSSAGPDSGNMDHCCLRCGKYWHIPLY